MDWQDEELDLDRQPTAADDIQLAAAYDACVLITADRDLALKVARDIARRDCRRRTSLRVVDCDTLDPRAARVALADCFLIPAVPGQTLLLREVQALSIANQTLLASLLASVPAAADGPRVIASSSAALVTRVQRGEFDDGLFYRLNVITLALDRATS